jgi:GNAT superfamily N-acetyltransferase
MIYQIVELTIQNMNLWAEAMQGDALLLRYGWSGGDILSRWHKAIICQDILQGLASIKGEPLGCIWAQPNAAFGRAYLRYLWLHTKVRGQGLGKVLLDAYETALWMPMGHVRYRYFSLVTHDHQSTRRFYERCGYQLIGCMEGFIKKGITECIFAKP